VGDLLHFKQSLVRNQAPMLSWSPGIGAFLFECPAVTQPWPLVRYFCRPVGEYSVPLF
jgi:hypothetical protein